MGESSHKEFPDLTRFSILFPGSSLGTRRMTPRAKSCRGNRNEAVLKQYGVSQSRLNGK